MQLSALFYFEETSKSVAKVLPKYCPIIRLQRGVNDIAESKHK